MVFLKRNEWNDDGHRGGGTETRDLSPVKKICFAVSNRNLRSPIMCKGNQQDSLLSDSDHVPFCFLLLVVSVCVCWLVIFRFTRH